MSDIFKYSYCSSCNSKSNIQALTSKILYTDFLMLHYQVYCTNPHYMWRIQSLFFHQCCNYALLFHWWVQQSHTYFQCIVWTLNFQCSKFLSNKFLRSLGFCNSLHILVLYSTGIRFDGTSRFCRNNTSTMCLKEWWAGFQAEI